MCEMMFDDVQKVTVSLWGTLKQVNSLLFLLLFAENVTKYCDSLGNWIQTGPTCQPASLQTLKVLNYLPSCQHSGLFNIVSTNPSNC